MDIQVHTPVMVPLAHLAPYPDNPKKPMGSRYLRGLAASIERFGFCGVLEVGKNADGTATVLDGNTRLELLEKHGVQQVPCQYVPACAEGVTGWQEARKILVLSHDRNRKVFDEDRVLEQLKSLAGQGVDVAALGKLTAVDNLQRLLEESRKATVSLGTSAHVKVPQQKSWVLYGSAEDVEAAQEITKRLRGRFEDVFKLRSTLEQAEQFHDLGDERFVILFLSALSRLHDV